MIDVGLLDDRYGLYIYIKIIIILIFFTLKKAKRNEIFLTFNWLGGIDSNRIQSLNL